MHAFRRAQAAFALVCSTALFAAACAPTATTPAASPAAGATAASSGASTQASGPAVNLTVGYFPTWVGGWAGAVIRKQELWKKYLPAGSTVDWDVQIVGAPIVNALLAGKEQIGYLGDTPAVIATTKRDQADIRIVETSLLSPGQICSIMLVQPDAPDFASPKEAIQWLNGKTIGVAGKGSCGDRFVTKLLQDNNVKAEIAYLSPETIRSNMQAKKVDAAQQFEPNVSQIVGQKIGKLAFTGASLGSTDASFIIMRKDFIDQNHDAALGWMKAEIEAYQWMLANPDAMADLLADELPGWTKDQIKSAWLGSYAPTAGATDTNAILKFGFDQDTRDYLTGTYKFLADTQTIPSADIPDGAIYNQLADEAAKAMNVTLPLGTVKATGPVKGS
jgi:NitT/TauT family transport system substrate-binding protein